MPMHRRRVYLDHSSSRKARIEGWLSLSIFLAAGILLISLLGCLQDLVSLVLSSFLPEKLAARFGVVSGAETPVWTVPCEVLMTISGAYLIVAALLRSQTRQRPR
jgi:hypothetical protein